MASRLDHEPAGRIDLGPHPATRSGHDRERHERVEVGDHGRRPVEPRALRGDELAERVEQDDLAPHGLVLGAEHLSLSLVELGRRVSLGVLHRLLADVVGRHARRMRAPDLEEEAEHAVVAHLERRDAGAFDLRRLITGDPLLAAAGEFDQFVEGVVEAGADEAALAVMDRAAVPQRAGDPLGDIRAGIDRPSERSEQPVAGREPLPERREHRGGTADPLEIARAGPAGDRAADEPFEVAHVRERFGQPGGERRVVHEGRHGIEPRVDGGDVDERCREPFRETPGPERRPRAIEHADERALASAGGGGADEFETAARGLVDLHPVPGSPGAERLDARDGRRLVLGEVGHHAAGCRQRRGVRPAVEAEPLEAAAAERAAERVRDGGVVEPPVRPDGHRAPSPGRGDECRDRRLVASGADAFGRLEPRQLVGCLRAGQRGRLEAACRDVDPGDPEDGLLVGPVRIARSGDGDEPVGSSRVEQRLVGRDARCDDPRHLAAEQPLGRAGIVDLLADRDPPAGRHQLDELHVELVMGESRHRQRVGALVAARERQVEKGGGFAGVVAEEFVEVAHAEEDERPGAPLLRRLELPHHRRRHGGQM